MNKTLHWVLQTAARDEMRGFHWKQCTDCMNEGRQQSRNEGASLPQAKSLESKAWCETGNCLICPVMRSSSRMSVEGPGNNQNWWLEVRLLNKWMTWHQHQLSIPWLWLSWQSLGWIPCLTYWAYHHQGKAEELRERKSKSCREWFENFAIDPSWSHYRAGVRLEQILSAFTDEDTKSGAHWVEGTS